MNSSTSSSDRPALARWGAIAAVILLWAVALEAFTRVELFKMSKDFSRFEGYPAAVDALLARPGLHVAIIGNSATQTGVDVGIMESELSAALGRPVAVGLFVADASHVNTWYYMLQRYFLARSRSPDVVVVNFLGHDLCDNADMQIGRLAYFFARREDWRDAFALDLPTWSQRVEFVLASRWASLAGRARIKERVLDLLIPGYKDFAARVNHVNYDHEAAAARRETRPVTHFALKRFLGRGRESKARMIFVAYPTREAYTLDSETPALIREYGMSVLDLRGAPGLAAGDYEDWVHLNDAGRPTYSRHLAKALASSGLLVMSPASAARPAPRIYTVRTASGY